MSRRLSLPSLPRASASSTFARPSLKYIRVGTSVSPCSADLRGERVDLRRCRSSLRSRSGSWCAIGPARIGDVRADEPDLAVAHVRVGLLQHGAALSQRLDLGAGQHEPGLEAVEQLVVVPRAFRFSAISFSPYAASSVRSGASLDLALAARTSWTRTSIGSPRRKVPPPRRPTRAVPSSSARSSRRAGGARARSPRRRRRSARRCPSGSAPTISPSNVASQPRSKRRRSSSQARQISSARYSIFDASRSRRDACSASSCKILRAAARRRRRAPAAAPGGRRDRGSGGSAR